MSSLIVCHYGEIALKGKNRKYFEEQLVRNIKALPEGVFKHVKRISGRILVELKDGADKKQAEQTLKQVFGLIYIAFAQTSKQDIEAIRLEGAKLLSQEEFETFRVSAKRSEKTFPLNSQEINEQVGEEVINQLSKKVKLKDPDIELFIEIVEKYAFLYTEKIKCLGGLPVGVSGKAISLISGGIDSPVASFYAMKRGVELIYIHFHALPFVDKASVDKVKEIVKVLSKYQGNIKLYLVPFGDIQKDILTKTKDKLRVVLYRRFMMKISQEIAKKEKAKVLVTGENIGQVASQTLENIHAIQSAVGMPVLRPLGFFDKIEIIDKAKAIDTYNLSILPEQDCCSRFLPKFPETKADLKEVLEQEKKLDTKKLVDQAIKNIEIWTN